MFDIIAIDWGKTRFGLAFGSLATSLVIPCDYECFTSDIWQILEKEIANRSIQKIVIGIPSNFHGGSTDVSGYIKEFKKELQTKYPRMSITEINERGSTQDGIRKLQTKNKHSINHAAAYEILRRYFEGV